MSKICKPEGKKICKHGILYLLRLYFKNQDQIKVFLDKWKMWWFIASRYVLKQTLRKIVQGWRKIIQEGYANVQEGIKSNRYGKYAASC